MDQKEAAEFYDYLEKHEDEKFVDIAQKFNITVQEATNFAFAAAIKVRGEFIASFPQSH